METDTKELYQPGTLLSLMAYEETANKLRAAGGPPAALAALMQQSIQIGPRKFHCITASTAIFINALYGEEGLQAVQDDPFEILKMALAFQSPETCAKYLVFGRQMKINEELLGRDAFALGACLSPSELATLGKWCIGQVTMPDTLMPSSDGEPVEGDTSPLASGVPAPKAGPDGSVPSSTP